MATCLPPPSSFSRAAVVSSIILLALLLLEVLLRGPSLLPPQEAYRHRSQCMVDLHGGAAFLSPIHEVVVLPWNSLVVTIDVLPSHATAAVCLHGCLRMGGKISSTCVAQCWDASGLPLHKTSKIPVVVDVPAAGKYTFRAYLMQGAHTQAANFLELLPLSNPVPRAFIDSRHRPTPHQCTEALAAIASMSSENAHADKVVEVKAVGVTAPKSLLYRMKPTLAEVVAKVSSEGRRHASPLGVPHLAAVQFPAFKVKPQPLLPLQQERPLTKGRYLLRWQHPTPGEMLNASNDTPLPLAVEVFAEIPADSLPLDHFAAFNGRVTPQDIEGFLGAQNLSSLVIAPWVEHLPATRVCFHHFIQSGMPSSAATLRGRWIAQGAPSHSVEVVQRQRRSTVPAGFSSLPPGPGVYSLDPTVVLNPHLSRAQCV